MVSRTRREPGAVWNTAGTFTGLWIKTTAHRHFEETVMWQMLRSRAFWRGFFEGFSGPALLFKHLERSAGKAGNRSRKPGEPKG